MVSGSRRGSLGLDWLSRWHGQADHRLGFASSPARPIIAWHYFLLFPVLHVFQFHHPCLCSSYLLFPFLFFFRFCLHGWALPWPHGASTESYLTFDDDLVSPWKFYWSCLLPIPNSSCRQSLVRRQTADRRLHLQKTQQTDTFS